MPDTAAWSFVYASILANTGRSTAAGYGDRFAANVVEPPTIPRTAAEEMDRLMAAARATGSPEAEDPRPSPSAPGWRGRPAGSPPPGCNPTRPALARRTVPGLAASRRHDQPRRLSGRLAVACMKRFSPQVMSVDFGEIDCAHYGSWSRYVEAIRRTDALDLAAVAGGRVAARLSRRTLMLVLPDHGRELDGPAARGFIHHSDFYTDQGADEGCRRVWMLALGPGVSGPADRPPVPITAAAATGLRCLGLEASLGAARRFWMFDRGGWSDGSNGRQLNMRGESRSLPRLTLFGATAILLPD